MLYRGPVYDASAYAEEARSIVFALHRAGIPMCLEPLGVQHDSQELLRQDEIETLELLKHQQVDFARGVVLHHTPADDFNLALHGRCRVGRTMFETDSIPEAWLPNCEAMDEIWVPTLFNSQTFAAAGVSPERLRVLPSGVNTQMFRPGLEPLPIPRRGFNFLSIFEWTHRKAPDVLLRAYLSEFHRDENVALVLKTYARPDVTASVLPKIAFFVERTLGLRIEDAPEILLYDSALLSSADVPRIYASADAFVLPSRGESCGRTYMEALACECPVIATRWSGQMDFLHEGNSELIDCSLSPVPWNTDVELFAGHRWAEPSVDHLRRLMRHVFTSRDQARQKAMRGRERNG